jgi:hypothetical protein
VWFAFPVGNRRDRQTGRGKEAASQTPVVFAPLGQRSFVVSKQTETEAALAAAVARAEAAEAALAVALAPKPKVADRLGSCECGCGAVVRGKARFQMGHDAKLKSRLVAEGLAGGEGAAAELSRLGWGSFLEAAVARKLAKAARKAEAAAKAAAAVPVVDPVAEEARLDALVAGV